MRHGVSLLLLSMISLCPKYLVFLIITEQGGSFYYLFGWCLNDLCIWTGISFPSSGNYSVIILLKMFSMPLEWDSFSTPINHRFGLLRVYWNSWFYLLTNLSLSLFDFNYYSLHPSVLDILSLLVPGHFWNFPQFFFIWPWFHFQHFRLFSYFFVWIPVLHQSSKFIQSKTVSRSADLCLWTYL